MLKSLMFISFLFFSAVSIVKAQDNESSDLFFAVERTPEFKGGSSAMDKFIRDNLTYPHKALKHKKEGKIIVSVRIDKEGNVNDATVTTGNDLGDGLPEEALRIVRMMPKWVPASREQKPKPKEYLSALTTVSIDFKLPDHGKKK